MLQRKDPVPKTVADTCCILLGWQYVYNISNTRLTEAHDNMVFATTGTEDIKAVRINKSHATNAKKPVIM